MQLIHRLTLSLALAVGGSAATAAQVIDFDDLMGGRFGAGTAVTNQYVASLGVTFADSFSGGAHAEDFLGSFIPGSTSPNVLWVDQGSGNTAGQFLEISFASAVSSVSALFGTSLVADLTLEAFSGGLLIDSTTLTGATIVGEVRSGLISLADPDITSVRLYSLSDGISFNFSIDNLTFEPVAAVPEPASYALMLSGLLSVAAVARRRKPRGD